MLPVHQFPGEGVTLKASHLRLSPTAPPTAGGAGEVGWEIGGVEALAALHFMATRGLTAHKLFLQ